jgi:hypothetical protein
MNNIHARLVTPMCVNFFWKTDWRLQEKNIGYGLLPIPCPRDAEISTLLREWMRMKETARRQAISKLTPDYSRVLKCYSERLASSEFESPMMSSSRSGSSHLVLMIGNSIFERVCSLCACITMLPVEQDNRLTSCLSMPPVSCRQGPRRAACVHPSMRN